MFVCRFPSCCVCKIRKINFWRKKIIAEIYLYSWYKRCLTIKTISINRFGIFPSEGEGNFPKIGNFCGLWASGWVYIICEPVIYINIDKYEEGGRQIAKRDIYQSSFRNAECIKIDSLHNLDIKISGSVLYLYPTYDYLFLLPNYKTCRNYNKKVDIIWSDEWWWQKRCM